MDYNLVNYGFLGSQVASLRTKQSYSRSYVESNHYTETEYSSTIDGNFYYIDTDNRTLTYESNVISHNFTYTNSDEVNQVYAGGVLTSYLRTQDITTATEIAAVTKFAGAITTDGDAAILFLSYAVAFLYFPLYKTRTVIVSNYSFVISQTIDYEFYVNLVLYDAAAYTDDPTADLPAAISNGPEELTSLMQTLVENRFIGDDDTMGASYFDSPEIWVAKFDNRIRSF